MKTNQLKVQKHLVDYVSHNIASDRVVSLIAYGSSLNKNNIVPEDYDFILLLDSYNEHDFEILSKVTLKYPIELFIEYKDLVLRKGLDNYQRGRHGSYFIPFLAEGKCLIGRNFYKESVGKISKKSIKYSLLYRIEEYFYRIQKTCVNTKIDTNKVNLIKKYISRICADLMLFTNEMKYSELNTIHYSRVIPLKVLSSKTFDKRSKKALFELFKGIDNDVDEILFTTNLLYGIFLVNFEKYIKSI